MGETCSIHQSLSRHYNNIKETSMNYIHIYVYEQSIIRSYLLKQQADIRNL